MKLYSKSFGSSSNPTLLFIHGFLGSGDDWDETIGHLTERFHCLTVDLPGHGRSIDVHLRVEDSFKHCCQLIKAVLEVHHCHKYALIGYSLGGRLALNYAQYYPNDGLSALLLESVNPGLSSLNDKNNRILNDQKWGALFRDQPLNVVLKSWYNQTVFNDLSQKEINAFIKKRSAHNSICDSNGGNHNSTNSTGLVLQECLEKLGLGKQRDLYPFLTQLKIPSFFWTGHNDKGSKKVALNLQKDSLVNVMIVRGGHNIHALNSLAFATQIGKKILPVLRGCKNKCVNAHCV